ncbi:hypothetical protein D915_001262 [Fasciola hepatica]|uniref:Uncharacterized protein n=1 Tax=Fasciola hepatica TaxID=6192 RepID=A0A4E0RMC1_FASHE|nr:hypothetical protein D915_001262 [Fasciola hepatica]
MMGSDDQKGSVDFSHVESDYIKRVLGEPLHHGLCAVLLYQPLDPIEFLANYLRYWVKHVRNYRREKIAEQQIELFISAQIPWNVGVIAEQARRLEQEALEKARRIAEEEARKAAIERARVKAAIDLTTRKADDQIRTETAALVVADTEEKVGTMAVKKAEAAEKARLKAEAQARRRALEEEEALAELKEQEEGAEEEEEGDEDED